MQHRRIHFPDRCARRAHRSAPRARPPPPCPPSPLTAPPANHAPTNQPVPPAPSLRAPRYTPTAAGLSHPPTNARPREADSPPARKITRARFSLRCVCVLYVRVPSKRLSQGCLRMSLPFPSFPPFCLVSELGHSPNYVILWADTQTHTHTRCKSNLLPPNLARYRAWSGSMG